MDIEYISSQATARELQPDETVYATRPDPHARSGRHRTIYLRPAYEAPRSTVLIKPSSAYIQRPTTRIRSLSPDYQPRLQRAHAPQASTMLYSHEPFVMPQRFLNSNYLHVLGALGLL